MESTAAEIQKTINIFGSKARVPLSFCDDWFMASPDVYNHSLARLCSVLTLACYSMPWEKLSLEQCGAFIALDAIGMSDMVFCPESGKDGVDHLFAKKELENGSTLILCGAVGSHHAQWYTNFDSGTGDIHAGFERAAGNVLTGLKEYCGKTGVSKKDLKLLFIGHSRGGAAADLLAAEQIKKEELALRENIFAYTFAAPNPVMKKLTENDIFGGIFNFVNKEDFVTRCMPSEWGYSRFGVTLALPDVSGEKNKGVLDRVNEKYGELTEGKKYLGFPKGSASVDSLFAELTGKVTTVGDYYGKKFRFFGKRISVHEYFEMSLCAVVGHENGTKENVEGTKLLLKTTLSRPLCDRVFKKVSDFFVFNEGLGGATNGKLGSTYFSFAHDMSTYCAFVLSAEQDSFRKI